MLIVFVQRVSCDFFVFGLFFFVDVLLFEVSVGFVFSCMCSHSVVATTLNGTLCWCI